MNIKRVFLLLIILLQGAGTLFTDSLTDAYDNYIQGEQADQFDERERLFNQALKLYSSIEAEDAKLYFNIANCYYQLDQKGMAVWYYYKARALAPRDLKIRQNLITALEQTTSLTKGDTISTFFNFQLSNPEKNLLTLLLTMTTFTFMSLFIWFRKKPLQIISFSMLLMLCLFNLAFYFQKQANTLTAIVIYPTFLRCDAGHHYKEVKDDLEPAGKKVKILGLSADKKWIKVKSSSNEKGYVPVEKIKLL
ncbi:MAG: hypothetical protein S4CHLAM7_06950 [Chlamydiae bacterium]|nr:hypothetical protein [Chlamydiota bacterium]